MTRRPTAASWCGCARDTGWVRRLALRLGAQGRVLAPATLAEQVRADAALALAAYAD